MSRTPSAAPTRVLMVCTGNICRSPTAEAALRRQVQAAGLAGRIEVDSAGTQGWHAGEAPDPRSVAHGARRGLDLAPLVARQLCPADFDAFDVLLAMDRSHLQQMKAMAPAGSRARLSLLLTWAPALRRDEVPDPYYGGAAGFDEVIDLVEAGCAGWLAAWQAGRA